MTALARASARRLRDLGARPAIEPAVALALRSLTVRESLRFFLRELARRHELRGYTLRRSGLRALIRHRTPDVVTLGEVFHRPDYAFPPAVARRLGGQPRLQAIDLGANIGLFGLWLFGELPDSCVTAFEPDPANAAVLRETVRANGLEASWRVVEAAAGAEGGVARFEPGRFALSRLGGAGDSTVAVVDVLPLLGRAGLVKMDIEGGEWAILGDPRFAEHPPHVLVLEYHPYLAPAGASPREALEGRLRECGYRLHPIVHRFDGHGMVWAWLP
jgi:FkbM family methyltransferase